IDDDHLADTLERLLMFYGSVSKVIVWEHNTHVGDARATDMVDDGMYNIGELARLKHNDKGVFLVGFGTYSGSVIAGRSWGAPMKRLQVPAAKKSSLEWLLHEAGQKNKVLMME